MASSSVFRGHVNCQSISGSGCLSTYFTEVDNTCDMVCFNVLIASFIPSFPHTLHSQVLPCKIFLLLHIIDFICSSRFCFDIVVRIIQSFLLRGFGGDIFNILSNIWTWGCPVALGSERQFYIRLKRSQILATSTIF